MRVVVDGNGRLYCAYVKLFAGTYYLTMGYSDDGGTTWHEITVALSAATDAVGISIAIDSSDVVHVAYRSTYKMLYRQFSSLTWQPEEVIFDGTSNTDNMNLVDVAVDSADLVHVVWGQETPATTSPEIYYNNRSGGSWGTRVQITSNPGGGIATNPRLIVNLNDDLHVLMQYSVGITRGTIAIKRASGVWSGYTVLYTNVASASDPDAVLDASNNLHVIMGHSGFSASGIEHIVYTEATNTWAATSNITTSESPSPITCGILSNGDIYIFYSGGFNDFNTSLKYRVFSSGSWSAATTFIASGSGRPTIFTPVYPILNAVSTQISTSGVQITYGASAGTALRYYADSLVSPVPITRSYSRGAYGSLPATDANLSHLFSPSEEGAVAVIDGVYADQSATNQYSVFLFRDRNANNTDPINVSWTGKSNIAPTASAVYLEIYNRNSGLWETLDSNSAAAAGSNFTLTGTQSSSLSDYYDGNNAVACRVYQLAT